MFCPSARELNKKDSSNAASANWTHHYYGVAGAKGPRPAPLVGNYNITGNTASNHGGVALTGMFYRNNNLGFRDVVDGLSNTLAMGEISGDLNPAAGCTSSYRPWTQGASNGNADAAMYCCKNVAAQLGRYVCYQSATVGRLFNDVTFSSQHVGGAQFLMGDGTVRFVSENIDFRLYQSISTAAEGEVGTLE